MTAVVEKETLSAVEPSHRNINGGECPEPTESTADPVVILPGIPPEIMARYDALAPEIRALVDTAVNALVEVAKGLRRQSEQNEIGGGNV